MKISDQGLELTMADELKEEERTRCEVWCRVMGYHRPVAQWNIGKQQEHRDRLLFEEHTHAVEEG